jgi:hypothetical protein
MDTRLYIPVDTSGLLGRTAAGGGRSAWTAVTSLTRLDATLPQSAFTRKTLTGKILGPSKAKAVALPKVLPQPADPRM